MPPGKVEINDVERRNTDRVQWCVIIDQLPAEICEIISQLQRFRRGENISRHVGRRIVGKRDAKRSIANHVEQQSAAKLLRTFLLKLPGKMAASVQTIRCGKLLAGFFAIEKYQFNFPGQIRMLPDYTSQFQQQPCA